MSKDAIEIEYAIYEMYVDYYNSSSNKNKKGSIEAYGHIVTILNRYENKIIKASEEIGSMFQSLERRLMDAAKIYENSNVHPDAGRNRYYMHRLDDQIEKLNLKLNQKSIFHELDMIRDDFSEKVCLYLDEVIGEDRNRSYLIQIRKIFKTSKQLLKMKMHQSAIEELEDEVLSKDYPLTIGIPSVMDTLYATDSGFKSDELNSSNEFKTNLIKKSKRMRDNYDSQIREKTQAMMHGNREKYLTENNTATTELYKGVHRKLNDIKKGGTIEMERPSAEFVKKRINELLAKNSL